MQPSKKIVTAAIAIGLLCAIDGRAQPRRSGEKGIVIEGSSERMNLMRTQLDLADVHINAYLTQTMLSIQQGHQTGIRSFAVWYRKYEHAKESAADSIAKELFKQLLPVTFKMIFPEAKEFIEVLSGVVEGFLKVGEAALDVPKGDINLFLDKLQVAEEKQITLLLDAPKEFRLKHPAEFEAAKWEYFEVRLRDPETMTPDQLERRKAELARDPAHVEMPQSVRQILTSIGVPAPGSDTALRVAEGVLAGHIHTIMTHDEDWRKIWPYSEWEFARAWALQEMDPAGNKARVCDETRSWTYFRIVSKRDCDALRH